MISEEFWFRMYKIDFFPARKIKIGEFWFFEFFFGIPKFFGFSENPIEFKKKSTFFSSNSSLITNLRSEFSKIIQKYEKSRFYHSKILKITEKPTNLKKSRVRHGDLKILFIDS